MKKAVKTPKLGLDAQKMQKWIDRDAENRKTKR